MFRIRHYGLLASATGKANIARAAADVSSRLLVRKQRVHSRNSVARRSTAQSDTPLVQVCDPAMLPERGVTVAARHRRDQLSGQPY
jgi:hypothetical protein